ncbi:MAG: hypothetical protein ACXVB9_20460 [Bdellovibrionota bacterium]
MQSESPSNLRLVQAVLLALVVFVAVLSHCVASDPETVRPNQNSSLQH